MSATYRLRDRDSISFGRNWSVRLLPGAAVGGLIAFREVRDEEVDARDGGVDDEITHSSPTHVLVTVTEIPEDGGSRWVRYQIQRGQ